MNSDQYASPWIYNGVSTEDIAITESTTNLLYDSVKDPKMLTNWLSTNFRSFSYKDYRATLRIIDSTARELIDPVKCGDEYEDISDISASAINFLISSVVSGDLAFNHEMVNS